MHIKICKYFVPSKTNHRILISFNCFTKYVTEDVIGNRGNIDKSEVFTVLKISRGKRDHLWIFFNITPLKRMF